MAALKAAMETIWRLIMAVDIRRQRCLLYWDKPDAFLVTSPDYLASDGSQNGDRANHLPDKTPFDGR